MRTAAALEPNSCAETPARPAGGATFGDPVVEVVGTEVLEPNLAAPREFALRLCGTRRRRGHRSGNCDKRSGWDGGAPRLPASILERAEEPQITKRGQRQPCVEDAKLMVQDCLNVILRTGLDSQEREEVLKEKYSMEALSLEEKRELQQILLKKDKMSVEEASLLKNLSSK